MTNNRYYYLTEMLKIHDRAPLNASMSNGVRFLRLEPVFVFFQVELQELGEVGQLILLWVAMR